MFILTNKYLIYSLIAKTKPILKKLIMMYICYVGSPFSAVLSSFILLVPSLIFNAVPDYEWYIIMIFNILYCVVSYFILQYIINKTIKNIPVRLLDNRNISRMVFILVLILMAISFSGGFLPIRSVAILTGSMRPVINPGDMVIIAESKIEDVKRGDIIEFKSLLIRQNLCECFHPLIGKE
jgi:signal peptidase